MASNRTSPVATTRSRRLRAPRIAFRVFLYLVVAAGSALSLFPFVWTFLTAGKDLPEMFSWPPTLLPANPNYVQVFNALFGEHPFGRWLLNSFQITSLSVLGIVVSATIVAYSFARFEYPGRDFLFTITLATMMLPWFVTLIPSYQIFYYLGWINTFNPLVVPAWLGGGAFNIFLMRQFFMTIPVDLDEAAEIDGADAWAIFLRILVPLCRPAIATMAILGFVASWNNFMGPLIYLSGEQNYTAVLGLQVFATQSLIAQAPNPIIRSGVVPLDNVLMMAAVITTLPGLILFFAFQRYFVQGIVLTGLKG